MTLLLACGARSELLGGQQGLGDGGSAVATSGASFGGTSLPGGGPTGSAGAVTHAGRAGTPGGGAAGRPTIVAGAGGTDAGAPNFEAGAGGGPPQPIEDTVWGKRFGDKPSAQRANALAVQPNGDFALTGSVQGKVDFGGGVLARADQSAFVAAYDANASPRWSALFGDAGAQEGLSIDVTSDGTLDVAGRFGGSIDFGGGKLSTQASTAAFLASFDHDGKHRFSHGFGDVGSQLATGVATSSLERPMLVGSFNQSIDFGGGSLQNVGSFDAFMASFDAQGDPVWSDRAGDAEWQRLNAIASSPWDESYFVVGALQGTAKMGACSTQTSQGGNDVWLGWLDSSGNCLRSARFGDFADQEAFAIATGKSGLSSLFVVAGRFSGTLDIGGVALQADGQDGFVSLFAGDRQNNAFVSGWSQRIGGPGLQVALGVTLDNHDNVIVVGKYEGEDVAAGLRPSGGGYDAFAIKYDFSGKRVWSHAFGGAGDQVAYAVGTDEQDNVYVAGGFEGELALSSGTLTSAGSEDIFVLKLAP